jgi:hypothetical protein
MLGGWEKGNGLIAKAAAWAMGDEGPEVSVMLGNGPGGMQLLPFREYGMGWLQIVDAKGKVLRSLPEKDPYTEIYLKSSEEVWWGLLRPEWLNPAKRPEKYAGLKETRRLIREEVRPVQEAIGSYYHPLSYAHYGVDPEQLSFQHVTWDLREMIYRKPTVFNDNRADEWLSAKNVDAEQLDGFPIITDKGNKEVILGDTTLDKEEVSRRKARLPLTQQNQASSLRAGLLDPVDPGDATVPAHSARHQERSQSPAFKGVFEQTGYDHQDSYKDRNAQNATLYSIVQIAKTMKW